MALTATIPGKTKHGDAILVRPHRSKNLIPADTYIHEGNKSRPTLATIWQDCFLPYIHHISPFA